MLNAKDLIDTDKSKIDNERYFEEAKIRAPLNVNRISGDLPTKKASPKNVIWLAAVGIFLALNLNTAWTFVNSYVKSWFVTTLIVAIVFGGIFIKTLLMTIFEEKKQKEAYKDFLDNKQKDLSIIWEVQKVDEIDVKLLSGKEMKIGYLDRLDGVRLMVLRCEFGSIYNQPESAPKQHYNALEEILKTITNMNLHADIKVIPQNGDVSRPLRYYYNNLRNYEDEDFVKVFTSLLDSIDSETKTESKVDYVYFVVQGRFQHRHRMGENLASIPSSYKDKTVFRSMEFLNAEEIDQFNSVLNGISRFDREELTMNKYQRSCNLGLSSVLAAYDNMGNVLKVFQEDFDLKRIVKRRTLKVKNPKSTISLYVQEDDTMHIEDLQDDKVSVFLEDRVVIK